METRIIVIEDEAIIAAEIKSTLNLLGHKVVGHAMNGDLALDLFASTPADLVLLDISIKGTLSGIDLAKVLRDKHSVPFVFLTSFSDAYTLDKVKETSPYGYIVKPFNENDLKVNIELALYKYSTEEKQEDFNKEYLEQKLTIKLTDREFELLAAFREGLTYKEAAAKLFISVNTVKSYQKKLFQTLSVGSRFELLRKIS